MPTQIRVLHVWKDIPDVCANMMKSRNVISVADATVSITLIQYPYVRQLFRGMPVMKMM